MGRKVRKCGFSRIFPRTTRRARLNNEPNCFRNPRKREFRDIFVREGPPRLVLCPAFDSRHSLGRRGRATFRRDSRPSPWRISSWWARAALSRPASSPKQLRGNARPFSWQRVAVARVVAPSVQRVRFDFVGKAPVMAMGDAGIEIIVEGGAVSGFRTPDRGAVCHVLNQELAAAGFTADLTLSAATLVTAEPTAEKTLSWAR